METNFSNKFSASIRGFRTNINDQIEYKSNKYVNSADDLALKQSGINSQLQIKQNDKTVRMLYYKKLFKR